jgi:hypothetical protein
MGRARRRCSRAWPRTTRSCYAELARETLESLRVRFTRRRYRENLQRLQHERSELTDAIVKMAEGVELPGRAHADGRVAQ